MPPFREHIFFKLLSVPEQPALGEIRVPKQLHHIILGTLGCPSWSLTASPEGHRSTEILCDRLSFRRGHTLHLPALSKCPEQFGDI